MGMLDWFGMLAGGASMAAPIFNTKLNIDAAKEAAKEERAWKENMSQWEFDKNKEAWQMVNEYNTPQAQMERFSKAGLNPHLMYQQGSTGNASGVNFNAPKEASFPHAEYNLQNLLGAVGGVQMLHKQTAEIDKVKEETDLIRREQDNKFVEYINKLADFENNYAIAGDSTTYTDPIKKREHTGKTGYQFGTVPGQGLKAYQREAVRAGITQKEAQTNLSRSLNKWADMRVQEYNDKGIDISRDSVVDRELQKFLGSAGIKAADPLIRSLMQLIKRTPGARTITKMR